MLANQLWRPDCDENVGKKDADTNSLVHQAVNKDTMPQAGLQGKNPPKPVTSKNKINVIPPTPSISLKLAYKVPHILEMYMLQGEGIITSHSLVWLRG